MSRMDVTRVAIIGAGSEVAPDHFAAFCALEGVQVVAGVDVAATARERVAESWGVPVYAATSRS